MANEKNATRKDALEAWTMLKDMKVKNWQPVMAPVMEGNLNFSAIFHALEASNCKYMLVEQDDCYGESPFDCLKTSYENLANAGYR